MKKEDRRREAAKQKALRKKKQRRRRRKRIILLVLEIIILCVLLVIAYAVFKLDKLNLTSLNNIDNNGWKQEGYTNIALFGTDNRAGETEGVRSDCIIVASINNETKEVKLMSVYRDTMLSQSEGHYDKANAAYALGGPEAAVSMLNRNLDLDITDYVSVNFLAVADVVDLLGGIDLEVTDEEVVHMNNYCVETSEITEKDYARIDPEVAGTYHLNGVQAVSYCRIRYTSGGDFTRTERQRLVLEKIAEKAKKAKLSTLNNIIDAVLPEVSTSFSSSEIVKLAAGVFDYKIVDNKGFPFELETPESVSGYTGSYVVAVGLENNVRQAHEFFFPDEEYEPTESLKHISEELCYITGIYPNTDEEMQDDIENTE